MGLEINKRITECRDKVNMSKRELAERLGLKYTTYCRMEEKAKRITNAEVERIAEAIGADPYYILYGTERPKENIFSPLEPKVIVVENPNRGAAPFEYPSKPVTEYTENEFSCSSEERAMIRKYRSLHWEKKREVRDFFNKL